MPVRSLVIPIPSGDMESPSYRLDIAELIKEELVHYVHPLEALAMQAPED